jgi:hypothetical protein
MSVKSVSLRAVRYLTRVTVRTVLAGDESNLVHGIHGTAARRAYATHHGTGPQSCGDVCLIR